MIIKLLIVFGVPIVVALMTMAILRRRDDGKIDSIWQSLEAPSTHQVFTDGSGRVRFWLWGVIPLVKQEGPDVSRAALGRMVCETVWATSSLLPQRGVKWEVSDDESARATMKIGEETITLNLLVEPDGRLREIRILRWGNQTEDGGFGYIPFGGQIQEERAFGGYTIPSKVGVGWWIGTDRYFEFFRAQIENAVFR